MTTNSSAVSRPSLDEIARLGREAFERCVRPAHRSEDAGKRVAIALGTDDYAIESTSYEAVERIRSRNPHGEVFVMRTDGSPAVRMRGRR